MDQTSDNEQISNEPIDVTGLPRLRPDPYVSVDARHAVGSIAGLVAAAIAVGVVGFVIAAQADEPVWRWLGLGVATLLVFAAGWTWLAARAISYQVREHDLSLRSGVVSLNEQTVPFRRVQHVDLSRGLLDRSLGLSTLSISSAGPDISVPGLPADTATTLREWIVGRADLDDPIDPAASNDIREPIDPIDGVAPAPPEPAPTDGDQPHTHS